MKLTVYFRDNVVKKFLNVTKMDFGDTNKNFINLEHGNII